MCLVVYKNFIFNTNHQGLVSWFILWNQVNLSHSLKDPHLHYTVFIYQSHTSINKSYKQLYYKPMLGILYVDNSSLLFSQCICKVNHQPNSSEFTFLRIQMRVHYLVDLAEVFSVRIQIINPSESATDQLCNLCANVLDCSGIIKFRNYCKNLFYNRMSTCDQILEKLNICV